MRKYMNMKECREKRRIIAVIGKNYGDEGKGLVTASLCSFYAHPLIIKHNGGAQAGHTVEDEKEGKRFIHHQIGSGAEYGADTLFSESYHPDLFQLSKEVEDFEKLFGFLPKIFAEKNVTITTIDDVLINMALETKRGDKRHGSCGMGIDECVQRNSAGYAIRLCDIMGKSHREIFDLLKKLRQIYTTFRIKKLEIDNTNPYFEMLNDENVLTNFAEIISKNIDLLRIVDADTDWLKSYDGIIFETGQGLLLDCDYLKNAPHLTSSKTGLSEPLKFLAKRNLELNEAIYVTRPYVTRHGAGPLPGEFKKEEFPNIQVDLTNEPNEWQGHIRYAYHESIEEFIEPVLKDILYNEELLDGREIKPSLAVTHLDETEGLIYFSDQNISFEELVRILSARFDVFYYSDNRMNMTKI